MTKDEAIKILSLHLMQCGMMMPIEWVQKNGDGSDFMKAYEMAMDALKNEPVQEWISVKDRLPEEDERVIVWIGNNRYNDVQKDIDRVHNGRWVRWGGCVTHWSPWNMPQPPKGD